jgi:hypothetical protein
MAFSQICPERQEASSLFGKFSPSLSQKLLIFVWKKPGLDGLKICLESHQAYYGGVLIHMSPAV